MNFRILPKVLAVARYVLIGALSVGNLWAADPADQEKSIEEIYISANLRNLTLEDAFVKIVEKTNLNFQYTQEMVDKKKVNRNFVNASLGTVLRTISKETGLSFKRIKETIYVQPSPSKKVVVTEQLSAVEMQPLQLAAREPKAGMRTAFQSEAVARMLDNALKYRQSRCRVR